MKTFLDFEKEVNLGKTRNVYFLLTTDNYFVTKASELLREKLFGNKDSRDNFFLKYADETSIQELIDLTNNFASLFSSTKIIVLKRTEKYSRKIDELFEFVKIADPDSILLLCFDKEYASDKKLYKEYEFYDFTYLSDEAMKNWIQKEFSVYGKKINNEALEYLTANMPDSFDLFHKEIEKICTYDPDSTDEIDKKLILKFTGYENELTPNDLMKAIIRNDSVKAVQILDNLINKAGINEIYLVSVISNYYFDLLSFKSGKFRGYDNYSLYGKYKIWGERLDFAKEYSNLLKISDLEKAIALILDLDTKLKTSMLDSNVLLTSLVEELSSM
ncbi:MAG TPA: DNA polymerase III subunit delta [Ignavibacteria bacterium]